MFSPNLTHGAPGRHVGADGSHVAPRGRLTEIAGSSRLLSPAATSDAQMGVPPLFSLPLLKLSATAAASIDRHEHCNFAVSGAALAH
jgi:hypothetical protein